MAPLPRAIDVAIIGAGAAGVAAARCLRARNVSCVLIEARERLGGRAHTIPAGGDVIDLGCEWLHSADQNPLVAIARANNFVVDEGEPGWGAHVGRNFPKEDQKAFRAASGKFWDALEKAAETGEQDRPASDFLPRGGRWNPLIQTISTYYNGTELENVSIVDLGRYVDTNVNWTLRAGYGALIAGLGADLPAVFDCAATLIDHSGAGVKIETTRGTIEAGAAIVTIPTPLIAEGKLKFHPALPDKVDAAAGLPLGLADKIFFEISGAPDLPRDGHVFGTTDSIETIGFDLRPRGRNFVTGFVGGAFARSLEKGGARAMEAEARRQLADMLGADLSKHLRFLCATAWDLDPFAQGAYSHALPGKADARETLASPVANRIYFAGEACSRHAFSTAHGAWETGIAAAEAYLKATEPSC
jgi:monoamine oxidase